MQMPRFKMDALGGSRATSGKNNRQLNNGTASFMETVPEMDRPRLESETANAPPSAPPPSDGKGFVYWARFTPPLQTRAYPHLGDHVLAGWLLLTEWPLPPMATFFLSKRWSRQMYVHVQPSQPSAALFLFFSNCTHAATAHTTLSVRTCSQIPAR